MDIPLGKFPDFQLHPPGKKPKDSHAAFPALGKAPGWIWISRRPGFGSYSQNFSPAAPPRFPNPSPIPGQTFPGCSCHLSGTFPATSNTPRSFPIPLARGSDIPWISLSRRSRRGIILADPEGIADSLDAPNPQKSTAFPIPASLLRNSPSAGKTLIPADPRQFPISGSHIPKFPSLPNSVSTISTPTPELIPVFPPARNVGKGIATAAPNSFSHSLGSSRRFPRPGSGSHLPAGSRRLPVGFGSRIPAPGGIRIPRVLESLPEGAPREEKVGSRKTPGSPHLPGGDPTRRALGSAGNSGGDPRESFPLLSRRRGIPPRIPGKAGAAPAARKEPGQEGGRSGRRSRGAATPPGSGGTFPDPGMPGILGILPRGAPIPILIPIPEWFRERWECQEGKPGRGWEPWGAPHPTVWGWLQSRDALGIPSGNGEPAG